MFEILGAWTGAWTPRHGVVIPPPPSRRTLGLIALGLLAGVALVALVVAPELREVRERSARTRAAELERSRAATRARIRAEQQPRRGRLEVTSRAAMLAEVGALIGGDARRRFAPDARAAACEPVPGAPEVARRMAFDCRAVVRDVVGAGEQEGARGALSLPYRAVVDFGTGAYAFCRTHPPPGEMAVPRPDEVVMLPAPCRRPQG